MTFKDQVVKEGLSIYRIKEFVKRWESEGRKVDLWDYLGMTEREYGFLLVKGCEELLRKWMK